MSKKPRVPPTFSKLAAGPAEWLEVPGIGAERALEETFKTGEAWQPHAG